MPPSRSARAAALVSAADREALVLAATTDGDAVVRAVALAALVRTVPRRDASPTWRHAATDPDAGVRRRAAELAPRLGRFVPSDALVTLLRDDDAWVAEAAAYAIGEHPRPARAAVHALTDAAAHHIDPLVREAAVAALGARGEAETLPVVLAACDDKPAIRRRAVLALAAFDGHEVEARLRAALDDRDWQVRQAAEDLLGIHAEP